MKEIKVKIKQKSTVEYPIYIGENLKLANCETIENKEYSKILCILDENIPIKQTTNSLKGLHISYLPIKAHDKNKTLSQVEKIWKYLYVNNFDRYSLIINIGGGVICDIGGFAASTYMRGIPFINIPTTLLAQVDASIGGKTGINFLNGKNIIGTFQQPLAVVIDVAYLTTLSKREFLSGYAEIIKHGIIAGEKDFHHFTMKKPEEFKKTELINIIEQSCLIKKSIIEDDINENGKRKILNLGHTLGHAIESVSHKTKSPLLHGEAVSIGISLECEIAEKSGILEKQQAKSIQKALVFSGLPTRIMGLEQNQVFNLLTKDKKNYLGKIHWTIPKRIGEIIYDHEISENIIKQVIKQNIL